MSPIVSAGTTDGPVAQEARETLSWMGIETVLIEDIGVAGPYRIFPWLDKLRHAQAIVVIAGMEGALPSVHRRACKLTNYCCTNQRWVRSQFCGVVSVAYYVEQLCQQCLRREHRLRFSWRIHGWSHCFETTGWGGLAGNKIEEFRDGHFFSVRETCKTRSTGVVGLLGREIHVVKAVIQCSEKHMSPDFDFHCSLGRQVSRTTCG